MGERFPHEALCVLNAALRAYNMANSKQKQAVASDEHQWSLVNALLDRGGLIVNIDEDLSNFDKEDGGNGE